MTAATKAWRAVVGTAGAAALLAACGGSGFADEPPEAILDAAQDDMKALSSVRMSGDITSDGEEMSIDMALSTDGDCEGSLGLPAGSAEVRSVDGRTWLRGDEQFWSSFGGGAGSQTMVEVIGDRWLEMPQGDGGFDSFCDLDDLLSEIDDEDDSKATVAGTEDVDGAEAVKVESKTEEGDPVTAWIATDAPHYILKMEVTEGEEPGTITFSDFDEELEVEAPAEDEVLDMSELMG